MSSRFLRKFCSLAIALPLAIGLSGCDPTDATPASTALSITPSLGMVRNATVQVRNSSNVVVGTGSTDANGQATVTATGSGPFVIEVLGDANAEYFDESTGTFLPFRAPDALRAIAPTGVTSIGVTGLTDMAHALWDANDVPLSNANINAANGAILSALGSLPALSSILTPPNPLSAPPTPGSLSNTAADAYAAILAGLADLGAGAASPALEAIEQMRLDIADGALDGAEDGTPIAGLLYSGGFAATFRNRVDNRINTLGNTALAATTFNVNTLTVPTWPTTSGGGGGGTGGGAGTTPATINTDLVGVYDLIYHASAVGGPYTDGQAVQVTVSSSGMLFFSADSSSLTNPFYRNFAGSPHTAEIIWRNSNQIEYALSDNGSGTFNEINIGDISRPTAGGTPFFLGQLRLPAAGEEFGDLQALEGSHSLVTIDTMTMPGVVSPALAVGDSFTINIDASGSISIPRINQTFDPNAEGVSFSNFPNSLEPHIELSKTTGDNGTPSVASDDPVLAIRLHVDNGVLVGAKLTHTTSCGSGCYSTRTITFEARPLDVFHADFISDLIAEGFPKTFTVIERSSGFAMMPARCSSFQVNAVAGTSTGSRAMTLTINGDTRFWEASYARLSGNDALRTLKLYLHNIQLDDNGNIRIQERSGNNISAVASSNPTEIAAAGCTLP